MKHLRHRSRLASVGLLVALGACGQGASAPPAATGEPKDPPDASTGVMMPPPRKDAAPAAITPDAAAASPDAPVIATPDAPVAIEDAEPELDGVDPLPEPDAGAPTDVRPGVIGARVSLQSDLEAKWVGPRETKTREGDVVIFTGAFNAGEIGGPKGHTPRLPLSPGHEYLFEYKIRFDGAFPWTRGGKMPGLAGGNAPTGCVNADANGFSARMMWRGGGELIAYLYDQDQGGACGNNLTTGVTFKANQWYSLKEHLKLNTGKNHDGVLQIWVDGRMVLDRSNMEYMVAAPTNLINTILFHSFFGGSTQAWAPAKVCTISFSEPYATKLAD